MNISVEPGTSAPYSHTMSSGFTTLPRDVDIRRSLSSPRIVPQRASISRWLWAMSGCAPCQRGRLVQRAFQFLTSASKLLQTRGTEGPTMEEAKKDRNLGAAD